MVKVADSAASTRSPEIARLMPAPAAVPFTAVTSGARMRSRRDVAAWRYVVSSSSAAGRSLPKPTKLLRSPPAQNIEPAPVNTTARTAASSWQRIAACISARPISRSMPLALGRSSVSVATPSFNSKRRRCSMDSSRSEDDDTAGDLAALDPRQARVHVLERQAQRDHLVEPQAAVEIEIDVARHVDAEAVPAHHRAEDLLLVDHDVEHRQRHLRAERHDSDQHRAAAAARHRDRLLHGLR